MVTVTDVQELIEGRGLEPGEAQEPKNPTVLNIVLERLMTERGIHTYDDFFVMFTEGGYELDLETFLDECDGTSGLIREDFLGGVARVLELDEEEMMALAWANIWGREPLS
jgi:hypothetical protein